MKRPEVRTVFPKRKIVAVPGLRPLATWPRFRLVVCFGLVVLLRSATITELGSTDNQSVRCALDLNGAAPSGCIPEGNATLKSTQKAQPSSSQHSAQQCLEGPVMGRRALVGSDTGMLVGASLCKRKTQERASSLPTCMCRPHEQRRNSARPGVELNGASRRPRPENTFASFCLCI